MSEMVERVRKAIEAHCYEVGFMLKKDAGNLLARAAIEAMRQPTDRMYSSGREKMHGILTSADSVWKAMIDAALGDGNG